MVAHGRRPDFSKGDLKALGDIGRKFAVGILLVSSYAAIRPRFGRGARTAAVAALFVWSLSAIFSSELVFLGMISVATFALLQCVQLVNLSLATFAGVKLYRDEDGPSERSPMGRSRRAEQARSAEALRPPARHRSSDDP
jgi:hypothetical protein